METLLTNKTASLTELRDPKRVIEQAGGKPVAILNRNQLEGYFVPASAVGKIQFEPVADDDLLTVLNQRLDTLTPVLDYLKDK